MCATSTLDLNVTSEDVAGKLQNISQLYNPREDLLEEDVGKEKKTRTRCYVANITLSGVQTQALIDTGAEITCISEEYYRKNEIVWKHLPLLPLSGVIVKGAIPGRATKLSKQIYLEVAITGATFQAIFLVVPHLSRACIIGIDLLDKLKTHIDLVQHWLVFKELKGHPTLLLSKDGPIEEECNQSKEVNQVSSTSSINSLLTWTELEEIVDTLNLKSDTTKTKLKETLWKYRDVFQKKPGRLKDYFHELKIKNDKPFISRSYPIPISYREAVQEEIDRMLDMNIIQRSNSPYINPLVPVKKKDGSIRLCLDARKLNDLMIEDWECPETAEVLFQGCSGVEKMSTLDLTSSFWQIQLHPASRKYTAFQHRGKTYEFKVVPFGLKTSTAALVRGLDQALRGIGEQVIVFIDDILLKSDSEAEHLEHLEQLLRRLKEVNLTINLKKSRFLQEQVKFLGFILTTKGIQPDPEKVQGIRDFPTPKNIKQLRGFLGLVNFYTRFSEKHAETIVPLLALLKKGAKWNWTEQDQNYFERVKSQFGNEVLLTYPRPDQKYYLETDASHYALGAILYQVDEEGYKNIVSLASRTLKGAELSYFTTEKELLAIIRALNKFRTYVLGSKLILRTDHKALSFLKTCRFGNARLTRWTLAIQDYDVDIQHCAGKDNVAADVLSRMHPSRQWVRSDNEEVVTVNWITHKCSLDLQNKLKNLEVTQSLDEDIIAIKKLLERGEPSKRFKLYEDIVYRKNENRERIYLPLETFKALAWECHTAYGHIGPYKVYCILNETFYYPKALKLLRQTLRECDSCQRNKIPTTTLPLHQQAVVSEAPLDLISIDFLGPLPKSKYACEYLLVMMDTFSKYTKLYPLKKATCTAAITKLDHFIREVGKPRRVLSDRGTQFTSKRWKESLQQREIQGILTSIRHPQANMVERVNRELARFYRTFLDTDSHKKWVSITPRIEAILNESYHDTIGMSPHEALKGKRPERFWNELIPIHWRDPELEEQERINIIWERIKTKGEKRMERKNKNKENYLYKEGQMVLVKACNISNAASGRIAKFMALYEGPYRVQERTSLNTYVLHHPHNGKERGHYHAQDMKPYWINGAEQGAQ